MKCKGLFCNLLDSEDDKKACVKNSSKSRIATVENMVRFIKLDSIHYLETLLIKSYSD